MKAYMLFSSSEGNCCYIKSGKEEILIDAGLSAKKISESLLKLGTSLENISSIFITHEHIDHIRGLNVICRHRRIPVYVPPESLEFIAASAPWADELLVENGNGSSVSVESMKITAFETPHDSLGSVCFRIEDEETALGYATDIGHLTPNVRKCLLGCENVVIESNYDSEMLKNGPYPYTIKKRIMGNNGHLSNFDCSNFLPELVNSGTKNFVLAHLSKTNNKPHIAFAESRGVLNSKGIFVDGSKGKSDVRLCTALPDEIVEI